MQYPCPTLLVSCDGVALDSQECPEQYSHVPVEALVRRDWNCQRQRWDVTGIASALKESEAYPDEFGYQIVALKTI